MIIIDPDQWYEENSRDDEIVTGGGHFKQVSPGAL